MVTRLLELEQGGIDRLPVGGVDSRGPGEQERERKDGASSSRHS